MFWSILSMIVLSCVFWIPAFLLLIFILTVWIHSRSPPLLSRLRQSLPGGRKPFIIGFFHPYCNAGGGGERVLWTAIGALQNRYPHVQCVVYSGDIDATGEEIMQRVQERFNMTLPRDVHFVWLRRRGWVEAKPYPFLTLLGQSLGSVVLGMEAVWKLVPDLYIDTMGYAFTLPLFKYIAGCNVGCYVHYPTISTDMLKKVSARTAAHNNASFISRSPTLSNIKLLYYRLFAYIYGVVGKQSNFVMVNSTWTHGHILDLWRAEDATTIVYPPCDTREFVKNFLALDTHKEIHRIISVGQFRPEKDHPLQIDAFAQFLERQEKRDGFQLVLLGSCRNEEDAQRVDQLKMLAEQRGVHERVKFALNVSFTELKKQLQEATVGLHTMWNEHFGIGVVEMQAAGLVVLAHDSGGPKLDIVTDHNGAATGFLASDVDSYAQALEKIFSLTPEQRLAIRTNARASVERFSEEKFESLFLSVVTPFVKS